MELAHVYLQTPILALPHLQAHELSSKKVIFHPLVKTDFFELARSDNFHIYFLQEKGQYLQDVQAFLDQQDLHP